MNRDAPRAASGCAAPPWVTHQRVTPASSITQLRSHHPQARGEKPGTKHTYGKFTFRFVFFLHSPRPSIPFLCVCVCPIWPYAEYWNRREWLMEGSRPGSASHLRGSCVGAVLPRLPWRRFTTIWIRDSLNAKNPFFFGDISMRAPDDRPARRLSSACPSVPCVWFCGRTPVAAAFNAASSWRASLMENPPPSPKNLLTTQPVFF